VIDLERVDVPWEMTIVNGLPYEFPHIRGPMNRSAIVGIHLLERRPDGEFLPLPAALR